MPYLLPTEKEMRELAMAISPSALSFRRAAEFLFGRYPNPDTMAAFYLESQDLDFGDEDYDEEYDAAPGCEVVRWEDI